MDSKHGDIKMDIDRSTGSLAPRRRAIKGLGLAMAWGGLTLCGARSLAGPASAPDDGEAGYDQESMLKAATDFFGDTTAGLARVIEKAFKEQGRPNAYIQGEEVGAALTVGLRYGEGRLRMKAGGDAPVFWAGPSIGIDAGLSASKVFTLVYHLPRLAAIYQRFPGVDGSLYYVGGAGINYQRLKGVTLAPIRLGVGLRAGASVGYVHYRREKSINPF